MTDSKLEPELLEILTVIFGDVTRHAAPELFHEAFWTVLESESKCARLLTLLIEFGAERNDIDREALMNRAQRLGLSQLPPSDVAAVVTDAALFEAVVKRIHPSVTVAQARPMRMVVMRLVDRKGRKYEASIRPAITPNGRAGWILEASGLPAGVLNLIVARDRNSASASPTIATVTIPTALSNVTIRFGRLAGKETSQASSADPRAAYDQFQEALEQLGPEHRLTSEVEGFVVPQQRGARVVAFVAEGMCSAAGEV